MIKIVFYVVVGLLILSFFGVSLQHLVESPTTQSNFGFLVDLLKEAWNHLIQVVSGLWERVGI